MEYLQLPVGVIQICCIATGPAVPGIVYVSLYLMVTNGFTFQPWPNSLAALCALPFSRVAIPPLPGSPVGFSGLIDLVVALLNRKRFPGVMFSPFNPEVFCAFVMKEIKITK